MSSNTTNWVGILSDCLASLEREQVGSLAPFVDHEVARGTDGGPEDMTAWLICRNQAEQRAFADSQLARVGSALKKKLIAAGFPEPAVASLRVRATSREEVQQRGGYGFLRT